MERLTDSPDWSHDGQTIVYTGGSTGRPTTCGSWRSPAIASRVCSSSRSSRKTARHSHPTTGGIAYNSDLTGRVEVYAREVAGRTRGADLR